MLQSSHAPARAPVLPCSSGICCSGLPPAAFPTPLQHGPLRKQSTRPAFPTPCPTRRRQLGPEDLLAIPDDEDEL